jgi:archaemetzincin
MIVLVPIGEVANDVLQTLTERLPQVFTHSTVSTAEPLSDYGLALTPSRKQYHSTRLLAMLEARFAGHESERLLGVVEHDMYVPGLNFVFGEARLPGSVCVISTARLRNNDRPTFESRLVKEAVHELGHGSGLQHCEDSRCVMFFSNAIQDTDRKGEHFCRRCSAQLARLGA